MMLDRPFRRATKGPRSVTLVAAVLASLAPLSSCTWLVHEDLASSGAPCRAAGDCFAGHACDEGSCVPVPDPTEPPAPLAHNTVGPDGGVVDGPDGVRLVIPAGALDDEQEVRLTRASASLVPAGFVEAGREGEGRFYAVVTTAVFSPSATLEIPIDEALCAAGECLVYARDDDTGWTALPAVSSKTDVASALVSVEGVFGAGLPLAVVVDGGMGGDGGDGDGGSLDAGDDAGPVGPPSFAACDLSADACAGAEQCAVNPFASGDGVCVRACATVDGGLPEGCACCGALPGWSGSYCLPEGLCGDGAPGDACPNGTGDCDPVSSTACVDLGDGPVCTTPCDGSGQCGAGCCVGGPDDSESFCAPSSSCGTLDDGARCFDDATCASGRCESYDGVAPARCTSACTPGSCGAGLCCHPTSCGGEWLCVPDDTCAATTTLLCGDICLSDEACAADETCVDAACTSP